MTAIASPSTSAAGLLRGQLQRWGDLLLVVFSITVIALMVLPMPPVLLDALIAANLAFAIGLLLYSLYMNSPVAFSTFPSVLLITTLLRIAINVATTRQILLHANGGDIIATFGKLVVGGSLAVGLVVFIIVTVVQFIVIAKGAERVAEVIARFTLDAIPGKQMSIDSDLRAGLISEEEARRRRRDLENESRFLGAMDGAMKFVKGDAIASIVIILVNLLGGLAIGILVHDMSAGMAAKRYSVLSVGEGLAAQIPALFIALSAGIIVTRNSSDDSKPLAGAIGQQIVSQPRALILTGAVVALFSLVPGFPLVIFASLGGAIAMAGAAILARSLRSVDARQPGLSSMSREGSKDLHPIVDDGVSPAFSTLLIELAPASIDLLSRDALDAALTRLRRVMSLGPGLPFPGVRIRANASMPVGEYGISVLETPAARGSFLPGHLLVLAGEQALAQAGIAGVRAPVAFVGEHGRWVKTSQRTALTQRGIACWTLADLLIHHLEDVIERHSHRILGLQDAQALVQACAKEYPDLVREAMKVVPLPRLTRLLKGLAAEGISLRHMRDILQAAQEHAGSERNDELVIERIRTGLSQVITHRFTQGLGQLDVVMLDPAAEQQVRSALLMTAAGVEAALAAEQARALIVQLRSTLERPAIAERRGQVPLLTSADVRRPMRRLLAADMPWLQVISHEEVAPGTRVNSLGVIRLV